MARGGWSGFIDGEYLSSRGDYKFRYKSEYEDTVGRRQNSDIRYYRIEGAPSTRASLHMSIVMCPNGVVPAA